MDRRRILALVCLLFAATGCLLVQTATAAREEMDDMQAAGEGGMRTLKDDFSDDDDGVWTRYGGGDDDDDESKHTVSWYHSHPCKPGSYKPTKKQYPIRTYYSGDDDGFDGSDDKRRMLLEDSDDDGTTKKWYWPSSRHGCYVRTYKKSHKKTYVKRGDSDDGDDKRRLLLGRKYA